MQRITGAAMIAIATVFVSVFTPVSTAAQTFQAEASRPVPSARAAIASQFDPGLLISDALFYDGHAMMADEIQAFLMARVPVCTSSYACLSTYRQDTPAMPASADRCSAMEGRMGERAADIIARVGEACGISQKALLVLLEKEQSLVSRSNPTQTAFQKATGMGCPDTAPCDPAFGGFFYQVYYAARQFKTYVQTPAAFNHRPGRDNLVLFHPNAACGRSAVYIVNAATAGLYNYTPYQPNAAALANLYGTGDACSSYGNRNFWRIYSDWFGSPTIGTSLVRAAGSPHIFLLSGDRRHHIRDGAMLEALRPLGDVATISAQALSAYPEGAPASRIIRAPSGAMYFHDAGIRLLFTTCAQVEDYGGWCGEGGYTQLNDYQINRFVTGPAVGPVLRTTAGGRYVLEDGTRRELADEQTSIEAGYGVTTQVLTEAAVSGLPLGLPIARAGIFVASRDDGRAWYYTGTEWWSIESAVATQTGISEVASGRLLSASLSGTSMVGAMTGSVVAAGEVWVLSARQRLAVSEQVAQRLTPLPVTNTALEAFPTGASIGDRSFVKGASSSAVLLVSGATTAQLSSWQTYTAFQAAYGGGIVTIPDATVAALQASRTLYAPGTLVKTASSPAVYVVDGDGALRFLPSFAQAAAVGIPSSVATVDPVEFAKYASAGTLGWVLTCGAERYLAAEGELKRLDATHAAAYALPETALSAVTCGVMTRSGEAKRFIRLPDGSIYYIDAGERRSVPTMARFTELGGPTEGWLEVAVEFARALPVGPVA